MIKELPESEGPVLGFEITSKVSLEEEKEMIEKFEKALEEHDKVSALVVLGEEASFGVKAGIEDLKWIMKNMKKLNKIAVVSESPFAKLVGISEKHFEPSELADAWTWVKE
jgi:hypothetical protein